MTERKTRVARWSRFERVLKTGAIAEKGNVAALDRDDSGALVVAAVDTNLFPIGYFEDTFTGDGVKKAKVRLFAEIDVHLLGNSATGPLDDGDVGSVCYFQSAWEVSIIGTGKSVAGRVWGVSPEGVWVQTAPSIGPEGPQGPAGP